MDPAKFQEMIKNLPQNQQGQFPPPGILPLGFVPPPPPPGYGGFPPPFPGISAPAQFQDAQEPSTVAGTVRRRGPLPSQEESLQMEQKKGRYTHAR
jgi:polyadenylation factor subunit 2